MRHIHVDKSGRRSCGSWIWIGGKEVKSKVLESRTVRGSQFCTAQSRACACIQNKDTVSDWRRYRAKELERCPNSGTEDATHLDVYCVHPRLSHLQFTTSCSHAYETQFCTRGDIRSNICLFKSPHGSNEYPLDDSEKSNGIPSLLCGRWSKCEAWPTCLHPLNLEICPFYLSTLSSSIASPRMALIR